MPVQPNPSSIRAYVSLSELAEDILGISRARLYELIARGAMPQPIFCIRTKRPLFDAELQRQALAVRQSGVGIDGSAVIWYRRDRQTRPTDSAPAPARARRRTSDAAPNRYAELVNSLQALGVGNADAGSVAAAVSDCFPNGIGAQQEPDVLRVLFRHLRRREDA